MKKILVFGLCIAVMLVFVGCEKQDNSPNVPEGGNEDMGDIFPPDDYKVSVEDQTSFDILKGIGLSEDAATLVLYNLKRAKCDGIVNIELDSSGKYYNIFDGNNTYKLYKSGKFAEALFDKDGNSLFVFIQ